MKFKNNYFIIVIILSIIIGAYFGMDPSGNRNDINLENEPAELSFKAIDLVDSYTKNEEKSNNLYTGKLIEVTGVIKDISHLNNRFTVILNSNSDRFGVICDINPNQKEKFNQLQLLHKIKVKGICKGFLKDVILLNCTIDLPNNE